MKTLGIKLADGSFYPIMEEGTAQHKQLVLTTANNNQTKVMVDLYRSANCNMDDAEYVDSLQIDNLVEHPNGEVSIEFDVSLDENNQLTAYIVDSETGRRSDTELPLITRTLEERQLTDEYNIKEIQKDNSKTQKKLAAGVGLLAMANAIKNKNENSENELETQKKDDDLSEDFSTEETISFDEPISTQDDIFSEQIDSSNSQDDNQIQTENDIFSENISDEQVIFEEPDKITDAEIEENPLENQNDEQNFSNDDFSEDFSTEETISFDEPTSSQDDIFSEQIDSSNSQDDNQMQTENDDFFNDLDLDNLSENAEDNSFDFENSNDSFENDFNDENKIANSGISFTGLYDKETENGNSASFEDEETKKKTKIPVIICIICAIICILATIFILFIIPSKLNVLKKNVSSEEKTVIEETIENSEEKITPEESEQIPEPIPPAKEDEIVIIENAEEVIPEIPEPAPQKPENIIYKIKWGDTLWDIADTYYKNPWKYKYIANYNNIKNPDYIISGTKITIPAE